MPTARLVLLALLVPQAHKVLQAPRVLLPQPDQLVPRVPLPLRAQPDRRVPQEATVLTVQQVLLGRQVELALLAQTVRPAPPVLPDQPGQLEQALQEILDQLVSEGKQALTELEQPDRQD